MKIYSSIVLYFKIQHSNISNIYIFKNINIISFFLLDLVPNIKTPRRIKHKISISDNMNIQKTESNHISHLNCRSGAKFYTASPNTQPRATSSGCSARAFICTRLLWLRLPLARNCIWRAMA